MNERVWSTGRMSDMVKPQHIETSPLKCYLSTITPHGQAWDWTQASTITHCPSHFMTWKQCKSSYMSCQRRRRYSIGDEAPLIANLGTRRTWVVHFIQPLHYPWWIGRQYQQPCKMRLGKCNDILNTVDRIKYPAHTRNWVPLIQSWATHYTQ